MSSRRRLELIEGSSSKFWEIEVEDDTHLIRFGRIGAVGQTKEKAFATAGVATREASKLVEEKLGKGYVEVDPDAEPSTEKAPIEKAMRTTLVAPPGHVHVVFTLAGKRLVTNDVEQSFSTAAAAREHLEHVLSLRRREGYTVASVEPVDANATAEAPDNLLTIDVGERWQVTFKGDGSVSPARCRKVVERLERDAPRAVQVVCDLGSPSAWSKAIAGRALPSIVAFVFDTPSQTQARQAENSIGDLTATLAACPSLERVFASGKLVLTRCSHDALRELHLLGDPLLAATLAALGGSTFPALERLVLSLAADAGPGPDRAAALALQGLTAPRLREVHVDGLEDVPRFLTTLARTRLPLRVLTVAGSIDEAQLWPVLDQHAAFFRSLEVLGLPLADELSSEAVGAVRASLPNVRDSREWAHLTLPAAYESFR